MKQADNMNMVLTRGTKVEVKVKSDEQGFEGAWYEATILQPPTSSRSKSKVKFFVEYRTLLARDGVNPLCEHVCVTNIRPFPPNNENVRPFEVHEAVDAYCNDGWWKGVVMSVREDNEEKKYKVLFEYPPEEIEFCASRLRVHLDWVDNKWVKPSKQIDEKVVKKFSESKLMLHLQFVNGKWVGRHSKDASLTSSCQGQSDVLVNNKERKTDVAVQLESANVLKNSCENPLNYSAILNSKYMGAKRRARKSKAESSSPCKKFREEKYATRSSSAECHKKSAPLEQLFGEKITSCMLPRYSSNPVTGNLPSVESMSPINSGAHEEEATVEADMMTSVGKSGVPVNSELKSQQISASGGEEITAEYMATGSLDNSCGSVILDQPQCLCVEGEMDNGKGETDNGKGALEEMFTPQFSADFIAGVSTVYIGPNRLAKSGGTLMDDQCQFLCLQEETSAQLVATQCVEKIATDDSATECLLKSCAASNIGGETNSKLMSTETSTSLSAIDFMTKKPDMVGTPEGPDTVGMTIDHIEKSHVTSAVHQPKFSFLEGHIPCNMQNQFDDQRDGETATGTESPVTNVEVNNALDENEVMPFIKNPRLWKLVDSLEIFQLMPQKPHFRPLTNFGDAFREGFAIGYMATFATVVEDISKLQITDSQNKFNTCLETLAELEKHGFTVKPAVNRVNMLLYIKDKQRKLQDQSKDVKDKLAERSSENARLETNILVIDNVLKELGKDLGLFISLAKKNNRDITALQQDDSVISEGISTVMRNFETLTAAHWQMNFHC